VIAPLTLALKIFNAHSLIRRRALVALLLQHLPNSPLSRLFLPFLLFLAPFIFSLLRRPKILKLADLFQQHPRKLLEFQQMFLFNVRIILGL
jgi:hypothetical protein